MIKRRNRNRSIDCNISSSEEISLAIKSPKVGKAAGVDNITVVFHGVVEEKMSDKLKESIIVKIAKKVLRKNFPNRKVFLYFQW